MGQVTLLISGEFVFQTAIQLTPRMEPWLQVAQHVTHSALLALEDTIRVAISVTLWTN